MRLIGIAAGVPFSDDVRLRLKKAFPIGTISKTSGRHYSLEEDFLYLVRSGPKAVIMPRMTYSESVAGAIAAVYGKENQIVGKTELSAACSDHP